MASPLTREEASVRNMPQHPHPTPKHRPRLPHSRRAYRVALFADAYLPLIDGSVTFLTNFTRTLLQMGHDYRLVVPFHPDFHDHDPRVIGIPSFPALFAPPGYRFPLATLRMIEARLGPHPFDLVHVHSPFATGYLGVRFAKQRRLPALLMYHTLYPEYAYHYGPPGLKRFSRALITRLNRNVCNQCDALTYPSPPMEPLLRSYGITVPFHHLPGGIQTEVFAHAKASGRLRSRWGMGPQDPLLLFVGRLGFEKSVDFLLQVLQRVRSDRPAHLVICGDGAAAPHLKNLADRLGLAPYVHFEGFIRDQRSLADYYAEADAFVFASQTDTQGIVLLEAMAAGVPVVAVNVLGPTGTITHGVNGLLAPPLVEEFSHHVLRVLNDPGLARSLKEAGRRHAKQFSFEAVTGQILDIYEQLTPLAR